MNFSFFLCLAAFRTRSSAWDTLSRICVRRVRCWPVFPLVPALRSTASAAGCPALFGSFVAHMGAGPVKGVVQESGGMLSPSLAAFQSKVWVQLQDPVALLRPAVPNSHTVADQYRPHQHPACVR